MPPSIRSVRDRLASHIGADIFDVALTWDIMEPLNILIALLDLPPAEGLLCSGEEYHVTEAAMRLRWPQNGAKIVRVSTAA